MQWQEFEFVKQLQKQQVEEVCEICYIKYFKIKTQQLRPAMICYNCWYEHVKTNLTKISYMVGSNIISPFEAESQIDVCIALNGLRENHKRQLQEWLFKKYTTFTKDIEKCPSQTCDYVFTIQKCNWMVNQNHVCPKCETSLAISQNFSLKSLLGFIYFIFLANKCPKCQIPIQRISGCPHMTCPCGHQFCWFCLKDHLAKQNNLYTVHEPKQCASIFFSKIIIFTTCLLSLSCFLVGGQTLRHLMEYVFDFLGYLIHSLILDLFFLSQWMVYNMYTNGDPYRSLPFQNVSFKVKVSIVALINLLFIGLLVLLQLLTTSMIILAFEVGIIGLGTLVVLSVMYSIQTWFQFIA